MAKQLRQKAKSTQSTKQKKSSVLAKNKATDEQVQPSAMKASPVKGKKRVSFGAVTDDDQKNSIDQQVNVPISKGNDMHKPSVSESSSTPSQLLPNKNTNYKKSITIKAKGSLSNNKKEQTKTSEKKNKKDNDDDDDVESLVDSSEDDYANNQQNEEKKDEEEDSDNESEGEDDREEDDDDEEEDNLSDLMITDEEDDDDDEEEEEEESSNPFVQSKKHHTPLSYPVLCLRFLPPEFQEPQLYKFLNQFGANVLNCFCVRSKRTHQSKGIAYVQMDQAEILPTLVEECHGMMLGNRAVQARIVNLHRAMPTKEKVTRRRNLAYAYKTRGAPMKKHNVLYKSPVALLIKAARNEQANNAHLQRLGIDYQTDFFTSQLMQIPPECITRKVKGLKLPSATKSQKLDNTTTEVEQVSSNHVKDARKENVVIKAAKVKHNHTHKNKKTNVKSKVHITEVGQNKSNKPNPKQTPVHAKRTTSARRAPRKAIKKTK